MQVNWSLIKQIAETKAIDLWLLFPIGSVNRLLTKEGEPPKIWQEKLDRFFGNHDWFERFYQRSTDMFDNVRIEKTAVPKHIRDFFIELLKQEFAGVVNPLELQNSSGSPLYLFCFAVSNPKAKKPALSIANDILAD